MVIEDFFEIAVDIVEVTAVSVLLVGLAYEGSRYFYRRIRNGASETEFKELRQRFGRVLLLCLELLVAADLIISVTIDRSFESLGVLAILIVLRTFLGLTLEYELGGLKPILWRSGKSQEQEEEKV